MSVFLTVLFTTLQYAANRAALCCKLHRTAERRSAARFAVTFLALQCSAGCIIDAAQATIGRGLFAVETIKKFNR